MRLILAVVLCLIWPASAQMPGMNPGPDPRLPVPVAHPPWHAVALIEAEGAGLCTGAMVAPAIVLTAAHCVKDKPGTALLPPPQIRVSIGGAEARGVALRVGAGFDPVREAPWASDWAMVSLNAPIGAGRVLALLRETPPAGSILALPGFQRDERGALLVDPACRYLGLRRVEGEGVMLAHDCAGTTGSSGGPLLLRGADGAFAIIGVQSKGILGRAGGLAVPALVIPSP
ncbi:MAG: trypsin-like peptidase domain-containing protein [Roseomonas sp.]|nr:trypsin-like peptidase domain-containing protein [Roseomonas sp.]